VLNKLKNLKLGVKEAYVKYIKTEHIEEKKHRKNLSQKDYEFMHSLSAAVLQVVPNRLRIVMLFWAISIFLFIIWAAFADIDEIARGEGEIIPSGENQMIQNLEGGIIEEIFVIEGESVTKGQVLVKINNKKSRSIFGSNRIKEYAFEAKIVRLKAESNGKKFVVSKELEQKIPHFIATERSLFKTNRRKLNSEISGLRAKLAQKRQKLSEAKIELLHLESSSYMINKEVRMTRPMVEKGVRSKIDFLKLQREANEVNSKYRITEKSIPRLKSAIREVQSSINEARFISRSEAKEKLNEALAELQAVQINSTALEDEVTRTVIHAPMNGVVQKLYVHTIGGVTRPGEDILEIVPSDRNLLVEVKIKPSDIAFIYLGQKAIVKFSAYDFAIYGGLDSEVVYISPDTVTDKKENVFYTVRIKTTKSYLGGEKKKLKIIPGMTVTVDIMTGTKSVLDYILKPILKTKQYTFSER